MMKSTLIMTAAIVLTVMLTPVVAQELNNGDFDLSWHTIDGGGGTSTGGDFEVSGTIGQPDAGAMTGGDPGREFTLAGGFWAGAGPTPIPTCTPDIAPPGGDGLVNVSDLLAVINGWGPCGAPCPPSCSADTNDDCNVDVTDLLAVINGWGACP